MPAQLLYYGSTQSLKVTGITSAGALTASATVTGVLADTSGTTVTGAGALSFTATSGETGSYDHTLTSTIAGLLTNGSNYNLTVTVTVGGTTVLVERFTFRAEYYTPGPSGALTTLSRVKEYLGIAPSTVTHDPKLTGLLSAASRAVAEYCQREFVYEADRVEYHNGGGDYFQLALAPVTVSPKVEYAEACLSVRNSHADTYEALVNATDTGLTLTRNGSDSTLAYATYTTVTTLAAAVNALGNGWTATVENSNGSFPSSRIDGVRGVQPAKDDAATFYLFRVKTPCHAVKATGKVDVVYSPYGWANVKVTYSGGYAIADMPENVQAATAALAGALYRMSSRETGAGLKREKLGQYEYENFPTTDAAAISVNLPAISQDAALLLREFKRVAAL